MMREIRQTIRHAGRVLHMRRMGTGRPVVLLHESPRSSAVLLPLAEALCDRFTVFAIDSPGFGLSDPLPLRRPHVADFADAVAASLRALGLERVPVYGTHTGATIAIAMAKRHPDLISGAILDGYPLFTVEEADFYTHHYLPLFEPAWDGKHVARLWSRVRDQYTFFPWNQPGRESRIPRDPPTPAQHTAVIRDFLLAGNHYAAGYEAAFRFDAETALQDVAVPVLVTCREDDLLFSHLDRLPPLSANASIERVGTDRADWAKRIAAAFDRMSGTAPAPAPRFGLDGDGGGAISSLAGGLLARCYDHGERGLMPLVLLHDLPGRARDLDALARREAERRLVIVPELPGSGLSPFSMAAGAGVDDLATALLSALKDHGLSEADLAGAGLGGLLALRMAALSGGKARCRLLIDPPPASPMEARLPHEPDWHGSHLMAAWYEARDRMLYRPWHQHRIASARTIGPGIDLGAVQSRFISICLTDPAQLPLINALQALAPRLAAQVPPHCGVVLQAGDPDADTLTAAFASAGTPVSSSHYDAMTDAAVQALRNA